MIKDFVSSKQRLSSKQAYTFDKSSAIVPFVTGFAFSVLVLNFLFMIYEVL